MAVVAVSTCIDALAVAARTSSVDVSHDGNMVVSVVIVMAMAIESGKAVEDVSASRSLEKPCRRAQSVAPRSLSSHCIDAAV